MLIPQTHAIAGGHFPLLNDFPIPRRKRSYQTALSLSCSSRLVLRAPLLLPRASLLLVSRSLSRLFYDFLFSLFCLFFLSSVCCVLCGSVNINGYFSESGSKY